MNVASMKTRECMSIEAPVFNYWVLVGSMCLEIEEIAHTVTPCLILQIHYHAVFHNGLRHFINPGSGCKMLSHCSFNLLFPKV